MLTRLRAGALSPVLNALASSGEAACPFVAVYQPLHCTPVRLGRDGWSFQLGRASAPTIPQPVHTIRGPNHGT
jgi:hypothetical protein